MKITFVLISYPWEPVGGYRVVYEYANHLAARGHEVNIIHPTRMHNLPAYLNLLRTLRSYGWKLRQRWQGWQVQWQEINPSVRMLYVPNLKAKNIPEADAVIATAWQTAEYVKEYSSDKGKKFYLIQHHEKWSGEETRVNKTWLFPLHKIVIANWLYQLGLKLGVAPADITRIPNGIDLKKWRLTNNIEERQPRVAMQYHSAEWKGCPDGLEALEIAKKQHPDLQAIFFSAYPKPKNMPSWVEYHHKPSQIKLVEIYNNARIYLCPSWAEGFHLPPMEAMACGCALVATDCSGVQGESARPDINALISPIKKPTALAANLLKLLDDDGLRIKLAQHGHQDIQEFGWEKSAKKLEDLLTQKINP
ncbi:glycosyltransferase family 4 protein [Patescibacteria group bacterium]|nr:glycosyltransferase family 4 protein [Patescibacteria group bacterium]